MAAQQMSRMRLTVLIPTEAKLSESENRGLLSRWKFYLAQLSSQFSLEVYSCDTRNYSKVLNVHHIPLPFSLSAIPFGNQVLYNLFLIARAFSMSSTVRVVGTSYFALPVLRYLFRKSLVVSCPYNYAETTRKDFGGVKGMTAKLRERLSVRSANRVVVTTEELQAHIEALYGKKSVVIPNFVDTRIFVPSPKQRIVVFAGRIEWHKGVEVLIRAFSTAQKKCPGYSLRLAGEGEVGTYVRLSRELGAGNVEFLGSVDNAQMPAVFGNALIFVLPTITREGHPKALIEAMACGCACVATDVAGNRDVIRHGDSGLLVPSGSVEALSDTLADLMKDDLLCRRLGNAAVQQAQDYAIEKTIHKEMGLIKEATGEND